MNSSEISVIIPFYNADKFLDRTLRNIVEEQFDDFAPGRHELILVNDGSSDKSLAIAREWQSRYPFNIKILSQKNKGVSAARNAALDIAQGRYIYFFDADDLLPAHTLPRLIEIADTTRADFMRFLFRTITPEEYNSFAIQSPDIADKIIPTEISVPDVNDFLTATRGLLEYPALWSVWSSLFRREFINRNNLRFIEGLHIGEDEIFMWSTLLCTPRLTVIDHPLHLYQAHSNNATNDTSPQHIRRRAEALEKLVTHKERIINDYGATLPAEAILGLNQTTAYEYQDLITYRIALGCSWSECFNLLRNYRKHMMFGRPHRHTFFNPAINPSKSARRQAWIASKILYYLCPKPKRKSPR